MCSKSDDWLIYGNQGCCGCAHAQLTNHERRRLTVCPLENVLVGMVNIIYIVGMVNIIYTVFPRIVSAELIFFRS